MRSASLPAPSSLVVLHHRDVLPTSAEVTEQEWHSTERWRCARLKVMRAAPRSDRLVTIPNAISFLRIALVPVFVSLIVARDTTALGFAIFAVVLATDWVDGVLARATGQISEVGKVLDPLADRIAIAAGLLALVARDAFPLWAALPILVRDSVVLLAGIAILARTRKRVDVRYVGKVATFALMAAIGCIAWGNLGYWLAPTFLASGWVFYAVGIVVMIVATVLYAGDARAAIASE
jgi:cardiolipin synthase